MAIEKKIAKVFKLEGDSWEKHTNPWSIWTRFATMPFLIIAFWSRVWIGWYCLIPITVIVFWLIINPTLFKKPTNTNNWGAKAVLGERYWSERKRTPVPKHHHIVVIILTALQSIGGIMLIIGLYKLSISLTIIGAVIIYMSKMWFLDRMIWIYEDMDRLIK